MVPAVTGKIGPKINRDQKFACFVFVFFFFMPLDSLIKSSVYHHENTCNWKVAWQDPQVFIHPLSTGSCTPAGHVFLMSPNCVYSPRCLQGMEHFPCKDRLRVLRLFIMGKRRLQGDLRVVFQYLKGSCKREETDSLTGPVVIRQGEMASN